MIVTNARRKGEIVSCCHGFKSAVWKYVLNLTAFSPGWRIHVIKQNFNLCCTFENVSAVLVSYNTYSYVVCFSPRYFYGLCHSGVSVSSRHLWIYSENVPVR